MSSMRDMMKMITQHKEGLSKHYKGHQNNVSPLSCEPEASSKPTGEIAIQKLSKFK